ncbi:MAG: hypothetical protein KF878_12385 [Planctomycetes bacterium]|nr:hypothetical protein [Planctomycetota bacterium]
MTDPSAVEAFPTPRFTLWVQGGCLTPARRAALLDELDRAHDFLTAWLGPAMSPGDFRPRGAPRAACPPTPAGLVASPAVAPIDVVVLPRGERCHADANGITLVPGHLDRRDGTHELVHYLAGSSWHPIDEGLAVYLTERLWGPDRGIPAKVRARVFLDLGLDTDLDPEALARDGMSRRDYDVAGAFTGWLIESFGKERFFELYAGPQRNYHGVYGQGEKELLFRFWQHVRSLDVRRDGDYHAFKAWLRGG